MSKAAKKRLNKFLNKRNHIIKKTLQELEDRGENPRRYSTINAARSIADQVVKSGSTITNELEQRHDQKMRRIFGNIGL